MHYYFPLLKRTKIGFCFAWNKCYNRKITRKHQSHSYILYFHVFRSLTPIFGRFNLMFPVFFFVFFFARLFHITRTKTRVYVDASNIPFTIRMSIVCSPKNEPKTENMGQYLMAVGYINSFRNLPVYYYTVDPLINENINRYESVLVGDVGGVMMPWSCWNCRKWSLSLSFFLRFFFIGFNEPFSFSHFRSLATVWILSQHRMYFVIIFSFACWHTNLIHKYFRIVFCHCVHLLSDNSVVRVTTIVIGFTNEPATMSAKLTTRIENRWSPTSSSSSVFEHLLSTCFFFISLASRLPWLPPFFCCCFCCRRHHFIFPFG